MPHILLRRGLLAVAFAGVVAGAAPGLADASTIADPTCAFNPDTHAVSVADNSGPLRLSLLVDQLDIGVQNSGGTIVHCRSADGKVTANILNTDSIKVFGTTNGAADAYVIDEHHGGSLTPGFTQETDGFSEIEVTFASRAVPTALDVQGTDAIASGTTDTIRFGRIPGGLDAVNYGPDNDVDYRVAAGVTQLTASGNDGSDIISATGNPDQSTLVPTTTPVTFSGGAGEDVLAGGRNADRLVGGDGADFFLSDSDSRVDRLFGGPSADAALMDIFDIADSVERQNVPTAGSLRDSK
jgi:hypothetical protein